MSVTTKLRIGPGVKILEDPLRSIQEWDTWKYSVKYLLRSESEFRPYLDDNYDFGSKNKAAPNRKFLNKVNDKRELILSAEEQCAGFPLGHFGWGGV